MLLFEPKRDNSLESLTPAMKAKVLQLLAAMKARGFDPVVFEAKRSQARQNWLYSIGRTRQTWRKPITWTTHSFHLRGNAVDIISKRYGWSNSAFYVVLWQEAHKLGLRTINKEQCHIQLR